MDKTENIKYGILNMDRMDNELVKLKFQEKSEKSEKMVIFESECVINEPLKIHHEYISFMEKKTKCKIIAI